MFSRVPKQCHFNVFLIFRWFYNTSKNCMEKMICSCSRIYNSLLVCYTCQWRGQWKRGRWTELKKVRPTLSGLTGSLTYLIALVSYESVISYQVGHQDHYTSELTLDLELILQRRNDWIARSLIASMTFQFR